MSDQVTLTIDGVEVTVPKGTLIVEAAKRIGNEIPVFCYHAKLDPVGMCRMCLVEVGRLQRDRATGPVVVDEAGQPKIGYGPKLETACTTPVEDGMVVIGTSAKVTDARDDWVEFILTSHPLDCPVCDKGGECPLQNLTLRHGPGQSRFLFGEKMHFEKHVPLGRPEEALIYLDRERCIQCARCTRFTSDVAGDNVLGFYERGRRLEIVTFSDPGFDSKFSGNTTDICPVGALTTADFRFGARPWELTPAASLCNHCPVGCNLTFSTRREAKSGGQPVIKRVMPRQNEQVNELWLCDKGRFGHHFVEAPDRLTTPLVRKGGELVAAGWEEALGLAAEKLKAAGQGVAALLGDRLSNEDLFAVKRVAEGLGGRAGLNTRMGGGAQVQAVGAGVGTNFAALGRGTAILVVASDLEEEAPLWWLRVKQAAERGATLIVANARPTKLDLSAKFKVRYTYGHEAATVLGMLVAGSTDYAEAFAKAENALILFGREGLDFAGSTALAQACANLVIATGHYGRPNNGLIGVWPGANTQGAWDLGLPARDLAQPGPGVTAAWIVAADPVGDGVISAADLRAAGSVVVQELFLTETAKAADVVLPAAAWAEREGTYTNGERRVQRFYPAVPARGRPDHQIAAELGGRLGVALPKFASQVFAEIAQAVPAYAGLTYDALAHVEPQVPDVSGHDPYYGGTAYTNEQGLGVQVPSGAERGQAVGGEAVDVPHAAPNGLQLVPIRGLYDRGSTFTGTGVLHPRVAAPPGRRNPADGRRRCAPAGGGAGMTTGARTVRVTVRVDGRAPEGAALLPISLGVAAPAGSAPVTFSPTLVAAGGR